MEPSRPTIEEIQQRCQSLGLPLTVQRRAILEVLLSRSDHPTAEDVAADLESRIPGISKATVYRALETFVSHELLARVSHHGTAARYDIRTDRHHHLVCDACGQITDFEEQQLNDLELPSFAGEGFRVRDYSVQVRGLCQACSSEASNQSNEP